MKNKIQSISISTICINHFVLSASQKLIVSNENARGIYFIVFISQANELSSKNYSRNAVSGGNHAPNCIFVS